MTATAFKKSLARLISIARATAQPDTPQRAAPTVAYPLAAMFVASGHLCSNDLKPKIPMKTPMKTALFALIAASSLCLTEAYAAPTVASFKGTITGFTSSGPLSGVSVGDPFTFQVYFDLLPTLSSNDSTYVNNVYVPPTLAAYWWFGKGYTMSASFGAYNISTTDNTTLDVRNSKIYSGPLYQSGFAIYNANSFTSGNFSSGGGTGTLSVGLFSTVSQPQAGLSFADASIESVVDYPVTAFNQNAFRALGTFNGVSGDINGQVTSYHISAVPEPSIAILGLVGAIGFCFRRKRNNPCA